MGFFSWKTSDTKKSIANSHSGRKTFTVHMITEDGKVFTENDYDGYGEFGGKDIYVLIAELNGIKGNKEQKRLKVIDMLYKTIITDGKKSFECGKDFTNWETKLPGVNKTANKLVEEGWERIYPNGYGEWDKAAKNGIKLPKLVQNLPSKINWKKVWDSLPYPKDCPDQGYFY